MKTITIGRIFTIYILIQITLWFLGCNGQIKSNVLTWSPTILLSLIISIVFSVLYFLSKFYRHGKGKWTDN